MFHRTERLFLRPIWREDAPAILRGIADKEIVANLGRAPWPYTLADAEEFVTLPQDPMEPGFAITLPRAEGGAAYIGQVGFNRDDRGELQIGYWLAREHWGKGYATEAVTAALHVGKAIGLRRVAACHFLDNPASGRVLRKVGFRPTGEISAVHSAARGAHVPSRHFSINLTEVGTDDGPMLKAA